MEGDINLTELMNITLDDNNINRNRSLGVTHGVFTRAMLHNVHKVGKR